VSRAAIGRAILQATSSDRRIGPCDDEQAKLLADEVLRLQSIISEVHAWAVCGCIASDSDMMKNITRICDITEPNYEGPGADGPAPSFKDDTEAAVRSARVTPPVKVCEICHKPVVEGQARYGPTGNHYECEPHKSAMGESTLARMRDVVEEMDTAIERTSRAIEKLGRPTWRGRGRSGR